MVNVRKSTRNFAYKNKSRNFLVTDQMLLTYYSHQFDQNRFSGSLNLKANQMVFGEKNMTEHFKLPNIHKIANYWMNWHLCVPTLLKLFDKSFARLILFVSFHTELLDSLCVEWKDKNHLCSIHNWSKFLNESSPFKQSHIFQHKVMFFSRGNTTVWMPDGTLDV